VKFSPATVGCVYHEAGLSCISCGSTRAFQAILELVSIDFVGTKLFLFFAIQLLLRIYVSGRIMFIPSIRNIKLLDIGVSAILFVWAFGSLILDLVMKLFDS